MARPPKNIAAQIDEMVGSGTDVPPDLMTDQPSSAEIENVGWLPRSTTKKVSKSVTELIEPLVEPGAISGDYKVQPPVDKTAKKPAEADIPPMEDLPPDEIAAPKEPAIKVPPPVDEAEMEARMAAREEYMGGPRIAPSGKGEGVEEGPVNTKFYDSDGLAATVRSVADTTEPDFKTRTVQSLFDRAILTGVPKRVLDQMFKDIPMESKIGDHKLAEQLAGLQILHDVSAKRVDDLMEMAARNELTDAQKYELREALSQHQIIFDQLKGAKRDVARAMNVFKKTYEKETPTAMDIRNVLEGLGGDEQLREMAIKYTLLPKADRAARNKMLERGLIGKTYDAVIYGAQAAFLSSVVTPTYNIAANIKSIIDDIPERAIAIPVGRLRQALTKIIGDTPDPDRYTMNDILARTSGFTNGMLDGMFMMTRYIIDGRTIVKGEEINSPLSAGYFSDTPLLIAGREITRTPDLEGTFPGQVMSTIGLLPNMFMKAIGLTDEFAGGIAARFELHEQAYRLATKTYDEAIEAGHSIDDALKMAQEQSRRLLDERSHEIETNVQSWRKQVTLQDDIQKYYDKGIVNWIKNIPWYSNRIMKNPLVKPIVLFSKSLINLSNEVAARTPILNFVSPRFYSEWAKGGRYKDLAISRVVWGGMSFMAGKAAYESGFVTGPGPKDTEEKNTWKSLGWQPFSLEIDLDDMGGINGRYVKVIQGIPGMEDAVSFGEGQFSNKMFISLTRLEPSSMPFIFGSAYGELSHYHEFDPEDKEGSVIFDAALGTLAEYTTVLPQMTIIQEFMYIGSQRQRDGGEKLADIIGRIVSQYGNVAIAGTPIAGYSNSALAGYIERIMNPEIEPSAMTMAQMEYLENMPWIGSSNPTPGIRGFFEAYNRWQSKIPAYNKDAPAKLDAWGDPIAAHGTLTPLPPRISETKYDKTKELVAALRHGLDEPRYTIDGVYLPMEIQERYKQLYAKEIKINDMDMRQAIYENVTSAINDGEIIGVYPKLGDLQAIVNSTVSDYREIARQRMFGLTVMEGREKIYTGQGIGFDYGLEDDKVEFPDFALKLQRAHKSSRVYGR